MYDFDTIIIGAGPAGSSLSIYLNKLGLKCLILDKSIFPRDKICGECISPGALNLLEEIGIKSEFEKLNIEKVTGVSFISPEKNISEIYYPNNNYGYAISRRILDKLIIDKAKQKTNNTFIEGFILNNIIIQKDKVIVKGIKDKKELTFTSKFLVGADGRYSKTAKLLNLYEFEKQTSRFVYIATFDNARDLKNNIELEINSNKYQFLISKQSENIASAAIVINDEYFKPKDINKDVFLNLLNKSYFAANRFKKVEFETKLKGISLNKYRLKSIVENRVLFVGDSLGFIDPITGEGMYRCFKSAKFASQVIEKAFREEDFSKENILEYSQKIFKEFSSIYLFIKTAVFLTTNEDISNFVVNHTKLKKRFAEKLISLQGALISGKNLYSFDTFKSFIYK